MLVADQVQHGMNEWPAPRVADDLGADDHVAELPRHPGRNLLAAVDREGERVGLLVDAEVLALEATDLVAPDERKSELSLVDPLLAQHVADQLRSGLEIECRGRTVRHLDLHHRRYFRRAVPVSSACSL